VVSIKEGEWVEKWTTLADGRLCRISAQEPGRAAAESSTPARLRIAQHKVKTETKNSTNMDVAEAPQSEALERLSALVTVF